MPRPALPEFSLPSLGIVIVPTSDSPTSQGLDVSQCAIQRANQTTGGLTRSGNMVVNATTEWSAIGGQEGFRTQWVVGGLLPGTNYTAWYIQENLVSQPIWFTTKQCTYPCSSYFNPGPSAPEGQLTISHSIIPMSAGFAKRILPIIRLRRPLTRQFHLGRLVGSPYRPITRRHRLVAHHLAPVVRNYTTYKGVRA